METTAIKIDENTIRITEEVATIKSNEYNVDFLLQQLEDIQNQKLEFVAQRNAEQADIRSKLKLCYILEQ